MPKDILLQKLLHHKSNGSLLPDKEKAQRFIEQLFDFLFNTNGRSKNDLSKQYDESILGKRDV